MSMPTRRAQSGAMQKNHIVTITEFLHKSIFGNLCIFVAYGQGNWAASNGITCFFFIQNPQNAIYPCDKNCLSCSCHKIVWKLAYLSVKMMPLNQKDKIVMKVANLGVSKLCILFKDIKSSGKLHILKIAQVVSKSREKILHFGLRQPKNCIRPKWCNFSLFTINVIKIQ